MISLPKAGEATEETKADAAEHTEPADEAKRADPADEAERADPDAAGPRSGEKRSVWKAWFQAARPSFYIATLAPLTLGFTAAGKFSGEYDWPFFLLILLACLLVHMAANLANDLFDHLQGVDAGPGRIGGSRVIQEGKISPRALALALVVLYSLALALAFVVVRHSKVEALWPLIIFAALSSFFYVAPPIKYGHRALGELFVFLNMGLIMTAGTFLALCGRWDGRIIALALPLAFMVAGILYYQSLPEIDADLAAGKRTLANLLGKTRAAFLFLLWWPLVWLLMINLWFAGLAAWPALLGPATAPLHLMACRRVKAAGDGDWLELDLHGHLVRKLYLINGLILIAAAALGG
ncbi:MAG: prenyltransferase [Candidatus Adiutrix sp.]|jgi:1,4-dihydroxy-2-naphthoate octaprenyltransferase|nr:prenyltransferase [Candidatus Adiutrix sp.]